MPAYYCKDDREYSVNLVSYDEGLNWNEYPVTGREGRVQMNIMERADGSLFAMFRSREANRIYTSVSRDLGRSWSEPERSELPNNNSSTQMTILPNGHLVLVYYDASLERGQFRWVEKNGEMNRKALRMLLQVRNGSRRIAAKE